MADIGVGDELLHSYRPRYGQWTREERREFTKFGYDFECQCKVGEIEILHNFFFPKFPACSSDELLARETELTAFVCDECAATVRIAPSTGALYCAACSRTCPYTMDVGDRLLSGVHQLLAVRPISVEQLQYAMTSARRVLHTHNKHLVDMTMTVAKALSSRCEKPQP